MLRFLVFVLAALVLTSSADAATFRSPALEAKLPLPYEVYVTDDTTASHVNIGVPRIYLSAWAGRMLLSGNQYTEDPTQLPWALAIYTLYHEFWHLAFSEHNEQNADLGALAIMRYMMRTRWGLSERDAQRNYEIIAGTAGVARSPYHPPYVPTAIDPLYVPRG